MFRKNTAQYYKRYCSKFPKFYSKLCKILLDYGKITTPRDETLLLMANMAMLETLDPSHKITPLSKNTTICYKKIILNTMKDIAQNSLSSTLNFAKYCLSMEKLLLQKMKQYY